MFLFLRGIATRDVCQPETGRTEDQHQGSLKGRVYMFSTRFKNGHRPMVCWDNLTTLGVSLSHPAGFMYIEE